MQTEVGNTLEQTAHRRYNHLSALCSRKRLFLRLLHFFINASDSFFELFVRVSSESWHNDKL